MLTKAVPFAQSLLKGDRGLGHRPFTVDICRFLCYCLVNMACPLRPEYPGAVCHITTRATKESRRSRAAGVSGQARLLLSMQEGTGMTTDMYERMRTILFGGHHQNPFMPLITDRAGIRGTIQGTPEEFSQILHELTRGELNKKNDTVPMRPLETGTRTCSGSRTGPCSGSPGQKGS